MQKWKKIGIGVLTGAISFTVLYYGALIALPNVVDLNKYKYSVSQAIEKETGFKVACENISLRKSLTPCLKIHMYHTLVLYPNDEVFLKLKEVDLKVKMLPLLFKKVVIKDAKLTRPIINITLYKDFSTSLEKYIDVNKSINTNGFNFDSLIYDTVCERYKIKFNDETTNKIFYLEGDELLLKDLKLKDKAHVALNGAIFEGDTEYIKYDIDVISALNSDKKQFLFSPFKPLLETGLKADIFGHLVVDKTNNINGELKVSDLSLTLDNMRLSDNEAKLNFKGKEVEIDAKLHTSKTDSAKINGKFNFGNKKYIDINTSAKNINLENLMKIVSEVSEILNVKNPLTEVKLKGFLDAEFNLNSDFKKLKSNGTAKLINTVISHKSLPYSISDINANINLNDNKIKIEDATAKVNNTPIQVQGVINEDVSFNINAISNDLNLKNIVNLFDLNKILPINVLDGKLSFDGNTSGILNKSYSLASTVNLSNLKLKDKEYNIPIDVKTLNLKLKGDEKKYSGEVLCSDIELQTQKEKISLSNLSLLFDDKKITIPNSKVTSLGDIEVSGVVNDYINSPNGYLDFGGKIQSSKIANLLKEQVNLPYKALGNIELTGRATYVDKKLNIKSKFSADKDNYLSYVVVQELLGKQSVFDIDMNIEANELDIKKLSIYENPLTLTEKPKRVAEISGGVLLSKTPIMQNLKVQIPQPISIATNFFGGEEISLSTNLILNKTINAPEILGDAKVNKYNLKKYLTSLKNVDVSFDTNNIRVIAPDVIVNDSSFNLVADIDPTSKMNDILISNLQLNSMKLDLNSLFSLIEREKNPLAESKITVKKGTLTVNDFKILDLKAKDISADLVLEKNILELSNLFAQSYGGTIEGVLGYSFNNGKLMANIVGKNVDIKDSLYDLCKLKDNLAGRADFGAKFSILSGDYNSALQSLSGNMQFNAKNGKMGTLGKFEYYLYAQNLFYHGLLNATLNRIADALVHDNTSHFREASGNVFFQNGYLITDGVQTIGNDMSLFVKGRHNMITNQSNIDIYGRISDEIKNKLGSFGNVSISEMLTSQSSKKYTNVSSQPELIMKKIPELYKQPNAKTNTFRVNIYGNTDSLSAINSFEWIVSDGVKKEDELPSFSDITQDL